MPAKRFPRPRAIEWLFLCGGLFLVHRYFWLMDDAFIYFRYIDNLLFLGLGLVFNQGEYVEGFSSPVWLLLLSGLRGAGLEYLLAVKLLAALAFAVFWYLLVLLDRRLAPGDSPTVNLPMAFMAFNYGILCYFSSGLEAPLVQVLAIVYALYVLRPGSLALEMPLALSPLVRHEMAGPLLIALLWGWKKSGRFPRRLALMAVAAVGSWLAFRVYYYADLFPNTFYVKDTTWYSQGLLFLHNTLAPYHGYVLIPLALFAGVVLNRRGALSHPTERLVMLALGAPVLLYVVRIGGDARHFRYLAFPFCLCACAAGGLAESFIARLSNLGQQRAAAVIVGSSMAVVSFSSFPPQVDKHPIHADARGGVVDNISDASYHRHWPLVAGFSTWSQELSPDRLRSLTRVAGGFRYDLRDPRGGCANFYRHIDSRAIQQIGFTQPLLARARVKAERPAHKAGLKPLRQDLVRIYRSAQHIGPGMYRAAVEKGNAPPWIVRNLERIEIIERKMFNRHEFLANLRLAFSFPGKIVP